MSCSHLVALFLCSVTISCFLACPQLGDASITRHYKFNIVMANYTRLCSTKSMVTVNGQFPGPQIVAREGDRVIVEVINHVPSNITIHWHGIRQVGSGWADGPGYITQCPIQTNKTYVYKFSIAGQRGTLFYHAHVSWLRASVYGPILILPPLHSPAYPFPKPYKEFTILLGEWFKSDPEAVIRQALQTGAAPNVSDAFTINGLPGPFYNCSANDTYRLQVKPGKTYLLRLINAALENDLFFTIANHTMTVVEADAVYIKPFETQVLLLSSGQTRNILLTTKSNPPKSDFFILARPYSNSQGRINNSTVAGILQYSPNPKNTTPVSASLPPINDTNTAAKITSKYRRLVNSQFPVNVPQNATHKYFFTVGLGTSPCPINHTCQGPTNDTKFSASINNNSFVLPSKAILESYYFKKSQGVYTTDFPEFPLNPFNYTGIVASVGSVSKGTKVVVVPFNASVEVVLQGTGVLVMESHPLHLHGYNFFVVGQGFGNYDPVRDPKRFNLVDPVELNTVGVPSGGWVAIRFFADNPGVWFMHCHFDAHLSWGLDMVWIVLDGDLPHQKLPPPPSDLPEC